MTDKKNGREYLGYVLEKLKERITEISISLVEGQKEIEGMHEYYWENYTEMDPPPVQKASHQSRSHQKPSE